MIDNKDGGTTAVPSAATIQPDSGAQEVYRGRAPGPFVPGISWRTWWKLFTNFLTLRKVVDEKERCLVFLQEVGNSNYELLESLLQGQELGATDLADLFNAMEKHFQPKKLILAERFGLMSKSQKPGQSLHEFYAELQKAANGCQFEQIKNHRDAIVTMVLIGGLQSLETRKRLLEKEDLTSKEALEHLEALKRVGINAPHLKEGPRPLGVAEVRMKRRESSRGRPRRPQVVGKNARRPGKGPVRERMKCNVCGNLGHAGSDCFRKDKAYCKVCNRKGHFTNAYWRAAKSGKKDSRQVHWCVEPPGSSDGDEEEKGYGEETIFLIRQQSCRRRARRPVSKKQD
ncbi:hypothetical protein Aduo_018790 [Ancylostoma duodenale]